MANAELESGEKIEFQEAYSWLNIFDHRAHLSEPVSHLVLRMKEILQNLAANTGTILIINEAVDNVNRYMILAKQVVESQSSKIDVRNNEKAEVYIECGWVYYHIGDYDRASLEIKKARNLYISCDIHKAAVSYWLLGCILWRQSKRSDAIVQFESSCRVFEKMKETSPNSDWYQKQSNRMLISLRYSIDTLNTTEEKSF